MGEGRDFEGVVVSPSFERGIVYFISADHEDAPVKIGFTTRSIKSRIAGLQTGSHWPLRAVYAIGGDQRLEGLIHRMFDHHRLYGEWFGDRDAILRVVSRGMGDVAVDISPTPKKERALKRILVPRKVGGKKRGRPKSNKPKPWEGSGLSKSEYYRQQSVFRRQKALKEIGS